jgi:hypothetical protein
VFLFAVTAICLFYAQRAGTRKWRRNSLTIVSITKHFSPNKSTSYMDIHLYEMEFFMKSCVGQTEKLNKPIYRGINVGVMRTSVCDVHSCSLLIAPRKRHRCSLCDTTAFPTHTGDGFKRNRH